MKYVGMVGQTIIKKTRHNEKRNKDVTDLTVTGGHATELSTEQLADLIKNRSTRAVSKEAADHCANAILNHTGGNNAGEALGGVQYKTHAIYHNTRNKPTVAQGCTVFFCDVGGGFAKLIAVGNHIGTKPNVYALEWVTPDFAMWRGQAQLTLA